MKSLRQISRVFSWSYSCQQARHTITVVDPLPDLPEPSNYLRTCGIAEIQEALKHNENFIKLFMGRSLQCPNGR